MPTLAVQVVGGKELAGKLMMVAEQIAGPALKAAVRSGALLVQNEAKRLAPYRTGNLRRSIHTEIVESTPYRAVAKVGTDVEYAAMMEFGGVIRPRNAKMLAIPLTKTARTVRARLFPGLHVQGRKGSGRAVLVDAAGQAQYALVRSVTIKPHPYLIPAFESKKEAVRQEIVASLRTILAKAGR